MTASLHWQGRWYASTGARWYGLARGQVVRYAVGQGHEVTCLARGESGSVPDGARLVTGDRTRPDAYRPLVDTRWDLVVDVSRQPGQVRSALAALADRSERWVFVSSGSVYADHSRPGAGLDTPLLPALEGDESSPETYGEGKVACEEACRSARGDDVLLARSGLIVGYGDRSDRLGYWPGRYALAQEDGGPVLVPERTDRPAQFLDVQDLAAWVVDAGLRGVTGAVDAYGPQRVLGDVLAAAREVAGFTGEEVAGLGRDAAAAPASRSTWDRARCRCGSPTPSGPGSAPATRRRPRTPGWRPATSPTTMRDALAWERELGLARTGRKAGLDRADELAIMRGRPRVARSNYAVLTILGGFRTSETPTKRPSADEPRISLPRVHSESRGRNDRTTAVPDGAPWFRPGPGHGRPRPS